MSQIIIMAAILIYLAAMLGVGFYCSKQNNSVDDFYLGGRKLGPFVTAMSAEASDMSSWLLMGLPGVAYLSGVASAAWTAIGLAIGTYVNWLIVARRIRVYSKAYEAFTVPDFFAKRFGDKKGILTGIAALMIIIFFIPYTASGFAACGKLFSSLFGVNYMAAMVISAAVIVGYCALGGFLAASTTDLIQSIVMTIALVVVVVFGINVAGGLDVVIDNYWEQIDLFSSVEKREKQMKMDNAVDEIRRRFGFYSIQRGLMYRDRILSAVNAKEEHTVHPHGYFSG